MKKNLLAKSSLLLTVMLVAAMAFGCGNKEEAVNTETQTETQVETQAETEVADTQVVTETEEVASESTEAAAADVIVLGDESATYSFTMYITDADGVTTNYVVYTDDTTAGQALLDLGVIDDASFFTTVNGVTADWDADSAYWALYQNGDYATVGIGDITLDGSELEIGIVYTID